jgi:NAD(P)-dependent dehydrogenase (short-subunit alcohol dehydrogenase family)
MRILVTGAARAIGRATVDELAARGHAVVATARDISSLRDAGPFEAIELDVTSDESVAACLAAAGDVDAVVNNAALPGGGPLDGYPLDHLRDVFETNTIGALRIVQQLLPAWRARGSGVIVNVSSVQGQVATPLSGAYSASKYALEALSESLHYELGHFGIRVVIVQPGFIAPGMKPTDSHQGPEVYDGLRSQMDGTDSKVTGPGGRPGPELVARAIADAIDDETTPLRVRVGDDAELILTTRKQLGDAEFESTMRAVLGLTW